MDFTRLFDILPFQAQRYPQKTALAYRKDGNWIHFSTEKCLQLAQEASAGLHAMGVRKGDKIAILCEQSTPFWNILDLAILQLGAVVVPLHSNVNAYQLQYILSECTVKYCFVSTESERERIEELRFSLPSLIKIFLSENDFSSYACEPDEAEIAQLESIKSGIQEHDLATIVYTSGTTGAPKGVMLSHLNIVSNIKAILPLLPINHTKIAVSFLPLSHIFERLTTFIYMVAGTSLYYIESIEKVSETLREVKPHYFSSVPRLLEKVYQNIIEERDNRNVLQQKIINWALNIGSQYESVQQETIPFIIKKTIADWCVYRHWRKALGSRVEGIIVGAAALQPSLGRLFSAAKIPIREGYGMTETSPVIAFNRFEPGGVRFGTVGIPLTGVNVRIDAPNEKGEGEIMVQGPNVMLGYYLKKAETDAVLQNGWLRTGDIGKMVHKRFLQITDRKKDIFKTTHGKYVSPIHVENHLRSSSMIEQCMVSGANRPYVVALIVPSFGQLKKWCAENRVHWTAPQYMVINPKVEKMFNKLIYALNEDLENHERIQKYALLFEDWSIEGSELTPTLKIRRSMISEKYKDALSGLY
jgi:long-chain acyl-CoA synthetase